jgi:hypothetical protein
MSADTAAKGGLKSGLAERISAIEEAYEFMLAYAAQGHQRGHEGDHIRDYLKRADAALDGIAEAATTLVVDDAKVFNPFLVTLADDARKARAGLKLVLAQRAINSQLVDNLNASIHLRALLTDLFLLDEAIASKDS